MHTLSDKKLLMLKPQEIKPSPNQPRKSFDEYELSRLSDSIAASGIIEPLAVRKTEEGYVLIAGERRLKAAAMAGLRRVPCILHKTDEETAALMSLTENLQRSNLNPFEEAESINSLIERYGLSRTETAARLGFAQSTLSNKLRILRLSEGIRQRIISSGLTERHARALLRLPEDKHSEALDRIIADGLTLMQTEEYINMLLTPAVAEKPAEKVQTEPIRKAAIGDMRLFSNSLEKLIGTLKNAGLDAVSRKTENKKYIEYKVRINKNAVETEQYKQLKIC